MSLTNTSPLVAPTRARVPMLGTNPIAVAAPAGRFGAFCLDMATSTIPRGRIEVAARRGEALLVGWAIDADGRPATTPEAALAGALQPLGGARGDGRLQGLRPRAHRGHADRHPRRRRVRARTSSACSAPRRRPTSARRSWSSTRPRSTSRAVRDSAWRALEQLVAAPTAPDAPGRVLIPGEPEAAAERLAERRGVVIDREHHAALLALGRAAGLPLPEVVPVEPAPSASVRTRRDRGPLRPRRRRRRHRRPRDRAPAARRAAGPADRDPREGGRARDPPDRPQQRRAPRRPVLRAGLAQGPAVPRGQGGDGGLRDGRTASRSSAAASSWSPSTRPSSRASTALSERAERQRRARARGGRPGADARDRAARGRHPGALEPEHRDHRLPAGRPGHTPTRSARRAARSTPAARSPASPSGRRDGRRRPRRGDVVARDVIACAGLQADRVAAMTGDTGPRPDRARSAATTTRSRPTPDRWSGPHLPGARPALPVPRRPLHEAHRRRGLGRPERGARVRPRGLPAARPRPARPGRRRSPIRGFLRLAAQVLADRARPRCGATVSKRAFLTEHAALRARDPRRPDRVRAVGRAGPGARSDGTLVDDFLLGGSRHVLHVRNAPSPAATASLAIGRELADRADERFELGAAAAV